MVTTGVELSFAIDSSFPGEIKAINLAELEAKRLEEEAATAAAAKKRSEEEAATAAAAKKRLEEEAATAAAIKKRLEEEAASAAAAKKRSEEEAKAKSKPLTRGQLLAKSLKQCKKAKSKHKRMQCERLAKKKYGPQRNQKTRKQ